MSKANPIRRRSPKLAQTRDVIEGQTVTLTGQGTDSDGTVGVHHWSQTSGTQVELAG